MFRRPSQCGYTVVELLVSLAIAALLMTGLQQLLSNASQTIDVVDSQTLLSKEGRFAMTRMTNAVRTGRHLLLPLSNNASTTYDEHVREQSVPASPPQSGSVLATAVLAVTVSPGTDIDGDGVADGDNDGDGLFDEDLPADAQNDGKAGLRDFDDDGNGIMDFFLAPAGDDDESNFSTQNEDPVNGVDDDGDGSIDEDPGADNNGDNAPGVAGFDDDGDGLIDEGLDADDDEDGLVDEDWFDPIVFYLVGTSLTERRAVPWDENSDFTVDGRDFVESVIAENVTFVRFERVPLTAVDQHQLVDITLTVSDQDGTSATLGTRVRVGASL